MTLSRRQFLRGAGGLVSVCMLGDALRLAQAATPAMSGSMKRVGMTMPTLAAPKVPLLNPSSLTPFVDALPVPPLQRVAGVRAHPSYPGQMLPYYRMTMEALQTRLHRDLPLTPVWGYNGSSPGPTLETARGKPMLIEWVNALPAQHFLPIDHTIHGAEKDKPLVRAVTHVHGARVHADSDGWPEDWMAPGKSAQYLYPGVQDAASLWYHDHAMGITRSIFTPGCSARSTCATPTSRRSTCLRATTTCR